MTQNSPTLLWLNQMWNLVISYMFVKRAKPISNFMISKDDEVSCVLFVSVFRQGQSDGNLLSEIQKLKEAICWSAYLLPELGIRNLSSRNGSE